MAVQTQLNGLDLDALTAIVSAWQADPDKRKTVWRARVEWDDGFRNSVRAREHEPIRVDEPTGLAGSDTAPNPAELLLGALGSCLSIGYALNAAARGIELRHIALELEGDIDLSVFAGMAGSQYEKCWGYERALHKLQCVGRLGERWLFWGNV